MPFPTPGDLPDPGIKPVSPSWAGRFYTTEPPGKPLSQEQGFLFFWVAGAGEALYAACGILIPRPGIEHVLPAVEAGVLTTGPPV